MGIRRTACTIALALGLLATSLMGEAQQTRKVYTIDVTPEIAGKPQAFVLRTDEVIP